jgi:hypothetical protein
MLCCVTGKWEWYEGKRCMHLPVTFTVFERIEQKRMLCVHLGLFTITDTIYAEEQNSKRNKGDMAKRRISLRVNKLL